MKKMSIEQMENLEGGIDWLEVGCIAGGIGLSFASGPAFAATASFTIHVCAAYILNKTPVGYSIKDANMTTRDISNYRAPSNLNYTRLR